jgi:muconolactone delta-isomerase
VQFLVISTPAANDRRDELRAPEEAALADMLADGFLLQIYRRLDGGGGFSLVEAPTEQEALRRLQELPFVAEGAIDIEVVAVAARYAPSSTPA